MKTWHGDDIWGNLTFLIIRLSGIMRNFHYTFNQILAVIVTSLVGIDTSLAGIDTSLAGSIYHWRGSIQNFLISPSPPGRTGGDSNMKKQCWSASVMYRSPPENPDGDRNITSGNQYNTDGERYISGKDRYVPGRYRYITGGDRYITRRGELHCSLILLTPPVFMAVTKTSWNVVPFSASNVSIPARISWRRSIHAWRRSIHNWRKSIHPCGESYEDEVTNLAIEVTNLAIEVTNPTIGVTNLFERI